jgi:hypothetical protein
VILPATIPPTLELELFEVRGWRFALSKVKIPLSAATVLDEPATWEDKVFVLDIEVPCVV